MKSGECLPCNPPVMSAPDVLLESASPNGNAAAFVEQDDRVVYMYLQTEGDTTRTLRTCWVRNLTAAPLQLDAGAMREGIPPLMPAEHCRHPQGCLPLAPDHLKVVWSEEGDAVALYEEDSLLAVIPAWSGQNGFDGYAQDCLGEGPGAWELGTAETNVSFERYKRAADYWAAWNDPLFWPDYQERLLSHFENCFGKHGRYFAIDGGQWPPKALTAFVQGPAVVLTTIGVGMRSQPRVELHVADPENSRRFELAVWIGGNPAEDAWQRVASYVSGQSSLPWSKNTWLGSGHTLPAGVFAELSRGRFPFALLSREHPAVPPAELPAFRSDPVNLLWMILISDRDRAFAMDRGSSELMKALLAADSLRTGFVCRREAVYD